MKQMYLNYLRNLQFLKLLMNLTDLIPLRYLLYQLNLKFRLYLS
jgi:hypothetical protein